MRQNVIAAISNLGGAATLDQIHKEIGGLYSRISVSVSRLHDKKVLMVTQKDGVSNVYSLVVDRDDKDAIATNGTLKPLAEIGKMRQVDRRNHTKEPGQPSSLHARIGRFIDKNGPCTPTGVAFALDCPKRADEVYLMGRWGWLKKVGELPTGEALYAVTGSFMWRVGRI